MIYCGTDIIEISRIENSCNNKKFLSRNFTLSEIDIFNKKFNKYETIAGNFAAKEAFSKAIGTGVRGFWFSDIEVLRDEHQKPYINFYNNLAYVKDKFFLDVSISHNESTAIAMVVLLKKN